MTPPPTQPLPPKKDVASLLLQGPSVFVHLDPRKPEVIVPLWFKKQPQLVLQLGLNMVIPIPDLHLDDQAITATLSFNRAPFWCKIPWSAVYALVGEDGRGMIWPDEVPSEIAAHMGQAKLPPQAAPPRLRAVPAPERTGPSGPAPVAGATPGSNEFPPHQAKSAAPRAQAPEAPSVAAAPAEPSGPANPKAKTSSRRTETLRTKAEAPPKARKARKPRTAVEPNATKRTTARNSKAPPKPGNRVGSVPKARGTSPAEGEQGQMPQNLGRLPTDMSSAKASQPPAALRPAPAASPAASGPDAPPERASESPSRRKRELPPYLRVIK